MSSTVRRESPLAARREETIAATGVSVGEQPLRTLLNLRGRADDANFALAVKAATGLSLPAAGEFNARGERLIAWLGPDEFLFVGNAEDAGAIESALRERLSGVASALTDVSSGFTTLDVSGTGAREFIARGWALDLHPRVFRPGHCAQSSLAKAPALLLQREAEPAFELIVRRSFAGYVWAWLAASAKGCGATANLFSESNVRNQ